MAEGQHLSSELGVGASANQAQLGEEAGKTVGEAEGHGPDHAGSAELSAEGRWPGYGKSGPRCSDRIDSGGFTAQAVQHQTDNGVGKRKEHDGRGSQGRLNTRRCQGDELTLMRVKAHASVTYLAERRESRCDLRVLSCRPAPPGQPT